VSARRVPTLTFALAAVPEHVATARHWVVAFAQEHTSDRDVQGRIAIAFSEAFANAVRHAYPEGAGEDVCVSADIDDGTLEVVVVDSGGGFRAGSAGRGLGAGMGLIAQCTDAFALRERTPSGIEVWMRFRLP
jgi:anti-sigma regulatory factor (Ser/Thr protein kinase)